MTKQALLERIAQQEELANAMLKICEQMKAWVEKMEPSDRLAPTESEQKGCASPITKRRVKGTRTRRLTSATFTYRWIRKEPQRIIVLYQHLLQAEWIAADTKPDDFAAIFSGEESNSRIKWIGTQQHLYYLIYTLVKRQIVAIPVKTTIWQITESHFTDGKNCPFHDFNKQKAPARAKYAIEKMVVILDLSIR